MIQDYQEIRVEPLVELLEAAGRLVMSYYQREDLGVELKADQSPVTQADQASNQFLIKRLNTLYPDTPIISEESDAPAFSIRKTWPFCWMIDPLDGTKEFLKHNGEFSINLALIHKHEPVVGFIHFPVQGWTYYAIKGMGAVKVTGGRSYELRVASDELKVTSGELGVASSTIRVMISRSHAGEREFEFIEKLKTLGFEVETHPHGSAMKHCLVAEGKGDIYPKFGPCSEWDTAPGQLILHEAGGKLSSLQDGGPLRYNKGNFLNPEFIMFGNRVSLALQQILLGRQTEE